MFNWASAPAFAAALLFWLLAAYVLTRGSRGPVSLVAVAALAAMASYLLGQGMQANAPTAEAWLPWARGLVWGAPVAPTAWYWVSLSLLREQGSPAARDGHVRWIGYPLGFLFVVASAVLVVANYVGDWLYIWSRPETLPSETLPLGRFYASEGPLYGGFVLLVLLAAVGTLLNLGLAWRLTAAERRRRFGWLLLSAALFVPEVVALAIGYRIGREPWPLWVNHLALTAAMALMAANVTAYERLRHGRVIRTDLLYFLLGWALVCTGYGVVFLLISGGYRFAVLGLLAVTLAMLVATHALADLGRRVFDRLFFGHEVRHLRSNLAAVVQDAALTEDVGALLDQAREEIDVVSEEHLARLTGEALRRLNNPAALAECGLIGRVPRTLAARAGGGDPTTVETTPLGRARAVRELLVEAIERLKPPDPDLARDAPAALQHGILREEYVLGMPNKQIMTRRGISESTFHRNRRAAIAILARELAKQEDLLSSGKIGSF